MAEHSLRKVGGPVEVLNLGISNVERIALTHRPD